MASEMMQVQDLLQQIQVLSSSIIRCINTALVEASVEGAALVTCDGTRTAGSNAQEVSGEVLRDADVGRRPGHSRRRTLPQSAYAVTDVQSVRRIRLMSQEEVLATVKRFRDQQAERRYRHLGTRVLRAPLESVLGAVTESNSRSVVGDISRRSHRGTDASPATPNEPGLRSVSSPLFRFKRHKLAVNGAGIVCSISPRGCRSTRGPSQTTGPTAAARDVPAALAGPLGVSRLSLGSSLLSSVGSTVAQASLADRRPSAGEVFESMPSVTSFGGRVGSICGASFGPLGDTSMSFQSGIGRPRPKRVVRFVEEVSYVPPPPAEAADPAAVQGPSSTAMGTSPAAILGGGAAAPPRGAAPEELVPVPDIRDKLTPLHSAHSCPPDAVGTSHSTSTQLSGKPTLRVDEPNGTGPSVPDLIVIIERHWGVPRDVRLREHDARGCGSPMGATTTTTRCPAYMHRELSENASLSPEVVHLGGLDLVAEAAILEGDSGTAAFDGPHGRAPPVRRSQWLADQWEARAVAAAGHLQLQPPPDVPSRTIPTNATGMHGTDLERDRRTQRGPPAPGGALGGGTPMKGLAGHSTSPHTTSSREGSAVGGSLQPAACRACESHEVDLGLGITPRRQVSALSTILAAGAAKFIVGKGATPPAEERERDRQPANGTASHALVHLLEEEVIEQVAIAQKHMPDSSEDSSEVITGLRQKPTPFRKRVAGEEAHRGGRSGRGAMDVAASDSASPPRIVGGTSLVDASATSSSPAPRFFSEAACRRKSLTRRSSVGDTTEHSTCSWAERDLPWSAKSAKSESMVTQSQTSLAAPPAMHQMPLLEEQEATAHRSLEELTDDTEKKDIGDFLIASVAMGPRNASPLLVPAPADLPKPVTGHSSEAGPRREGSRAPARSEPAAVEDQQCLSSPQHAPLGTTATESADLSSHSVPSRIHTAPHLFSAATFLPLGFPMTNSRLDGRESSGGGVASASSAHSTGCAAGASLSDSGTGTRSPSATRGNGTALARSPMAHSTSVVSPTSMPDSDASMGASSLPSGAKAFPVARSGHLALSSSTLSTTARMRAAFCQSPSQIAYPASKPAEAKPASGPGFSALGANDPSGMTQRLAENPAAGPESGSRRGIGGSVKPKVILQRAGAIESEDGPLLTPSTASLSSSAADQTSARQSSRRRMNGVGPAALLTQNEPQYSATGPRASQRSRFSQNSGRQEPLLSSAQGSMTVAPGVRCSTIMASRSVVLDGSVQMTAPPSLFPAEAPTVAAARGGKSYQPLMLSPTPLRPGGRLFAVADSKTYTSPSQRIPTRSGVPAEGVMVPRSDRIGVSSASPPSSCRSATAERELPSSVPAPGRGSSRASASAPRSDSHGPRPVYSVRPLVHHAVSDRAAGRSTTNRANGGDVLGYSDESTINAGSPWDSRAVNAFGGRGSRGVGGWDRELFFDPAQRRPAPRQETPQARPHPTAPPSGATGEARRSASVSRLVGSTNGVAASGAIARSSSTTRAASVTVSRSRSLARSPLPREHAVLPGYRSATSSSSLKASGQQMVALAARGNRPSTPTRRRVTRSSSLAQSVVSLDPTQGW